MTDKFYTQAEVDAKIAVAEEAGWYEGYRAGDDDKPHPSVKEAHGALDRTIKAAEEATVAACSTIADDHAEELIEMIGQDLGPNYGQADRTVRDVRVKDQAYTARIIGQRIRALIKSPGILATIEHQAVLRGQALRVQMAIANIKNRNLGTLSHDFEKVVNGFEAEIRRQERERIIAYCKERINALIISGHQHIKESGHDPFESERNTEQQVLATIVAELTAPATAASDKS